MQLHSFSIIPPKLLMNSCPECVHLTRQARPYYVVASGWERKRSSWATTLPETKYGYCVNSLATDDPRGANKIVQGPEEGDDQAKSRMGPEDKPKLHKCDQDHLEGQAQCRMCAEILAAALV